MNRLRKWWIWILVIVAIAGIGVGYKIWSQKNATPEYKTAKVEKGAITAAVSASGILAAVVSVQVGSQVSGQLKEILVDFNSEVKKGQLIARIDPETFEYKVRQAQADLESTRALVMTQQANIAATRANVSQAEVNATEAKNDLDRKQQLVDKGFISAAERDKARSVYNALAEQVKTTRAQVGVAEANLNSAQAVVRQRQAVVAQANIDLERTAIRAPVNGVVIKRSVENGQTVAASLQAPELFVIAENLADMRVDTSIDESEIGRIRNGQKATFTVDAFPGRTFEGTVNQIRKAAQTVSNVVTYTVEVSASNPRKELLTGMTANVRIVTDSRDNVFKISNSALRYRPPGAGAATASQKAATADAPAAGRPAEGGGRGAQMKAMRERLEKDLALTDAQKSKLDSIYAGQREKMAGVRDAAPEDRQKLGERIRADIRAQITDMLTPEQKKKYEEITAEAGDRRSAGVNARGRIYVLDAEKQPKEINVRLGLTDGTMTEIIGPEIKDGMEVITGIALPSQGGSAGPAAKPAAGPRMF